jgi:hypothetical protein
LDEDEEEIEEALHGDPIIGTQILAILGRVRRSKNISM